MDSSNHDHDDQSPSRLSSAEYRAKLLTKLNCLIAVLEVAIAKISRSMDLPGANEDRLLKIRGNLENTLSICRRAKGTLEKRVEEPARRRGLGSGAEHREGKMTYRDYVELSSIDEYQKFKSLPPIRNEDIASLDLDALTRQFFEKN